jgi:hypothetical protein
VSDLLCIYGGGIIPGGWTQAVGVGVLRACVVRALTMCVCACVVLKMHGVFLAVVFVRILVPR